MALGIYRACVLALAGLPYPHPTEDDYAFIKAAYEHGLDYRKTAKNLSRIVQKSSNAFTKSTPITITNGAEGGT
jgi:hypothetical protein